MPLRILLCCLALLPGAPAGAETYRWVDENGVVHYGDRVPPQYAKQQREVINQQGQTVKILEHEKTADERAADKRAAEEQRQQQEQARYDRYLISTFETEQDLLHMRDERLEALDGNIRITEMSQQNNEKSLADLKAREQRVRQSGKTPPPALLQQIQGLEAQIANNRKMLGLRQQERATLAAKFERDLARWRQLKGQPAAAAPASAADQGAHTGVGK